VPKKKKGPPPLPRGAAYKRAQGITTAHVEQSMQQNADAFVASVKKPFSYKGSRLPEPSPFPSVTGSFTQRFTLPAIHDSVNTANAFFGIMVWPSFALSASNTGPIWLLSGMNTNVPTWSATAWSNISTLVANFTQIRAVSLGFRFVQTTALLSRGGIGYVANTNLLAPPVLATTLTQMLSAEDVVEFDLSKTHELGDELTWNPSTYSPGLETSQSSNGFGVNLFSYFGPNANILPVDNKAFLWGSFPFANSQSMQIEVIVNWEAIPFNTTENLFQREVVVGSSQEIAVALEKIGTNGKGNPTDLEFMDAAADTIGMGAKLLAHKVLPQVPSLLKRLGRGFMSMFSAQDFDNHLMAVATKNVHLSPNHCKQHFGLSQHEFLKILVARIYGVELPDLADDEDKEEKKGSEPPPPSVAGSPSPSWVAVPSGLIANQPAELSAIPRGNVMAAADPRGYPNAMDGPGRARLRSLLFA